MSMFKPPDGVTHVVFSSDGRYVLMDTKPGGLVIAELYLAPEAPRTRAANGRSKKAAAHLRPRLETKVSLRAPPALREERKSFRLRPTFGGKREAFVATGQPASSVWPIWHWPSKELLAEVEGHSAAVNCVAWSPVDPQLAVTASDDATVRVWGPPEGGEAAEVPLSSATQQQAAGAREADAVTAPERVPRGVDLATQGAAANSSGMWQTMLEARIGMGTINRGSQGT